jgi:hypothetical protein
MNKLSLEKQFEHELFVRQVQDMSLDTMKKILVDLHLLYLGQQAIISDMLKQPVKLER